MKPVIIVNFKTYASATGEGAVALAKTCERVAEERDADIRVAVQAADIYRVASAVSLPVYAEHVDPIEPGRHTGYILPEDVKEAGAVGTLLNHSEHPIDMETLARTVKDCNETGLKFIICAPDAEKGSIVAQFLPEFVAVEPPELISGDVSVSEAEPELIEEAAKKIPAPLLVGAGIHDGDDVQVAMELGAKGVLLASGVTKADDPEDVLNDLLDLDDTN
ncbi:triosephosphate isomerase [Candidatus Woesearchaeota archaeon]|nr:MAG: triosephosphate isomerase [Candidatus Woesearchaeota archaeon]